MDARGHAVRRLTKLPRSELAFFESWSADGRRIIFTKFFPDSQTPAQLWVMARDGSDEQALLAQSDFANQAGRFSPDGKSVVFARCAPFQPCAIWHMDADGTNLQALTSTDGEVLDFHPRFSPDGASVAFSSFSREGVLSGVWLMGADGSGVRPATPPALRACCPDWSPDGRRLAFRSRSNPDEDPVHAAIWAMNPDGTGLQRLTRPGAGRDFDPSWAPRGNAITFQRASGSSSASSVYVMRADGRRLRHIQDDAQHPSWGARP
jgi:Tol biopolymer transport system component